MAREVEPERPELGDGQAPEVESSEAPKAPAPRGVRWPPTWPPPAGPHRWGRGELDCWHVIVGRNGCGKTTRARVLALAYARGGCRVLICDPDGQFSALASRVYPSTASYREELKRAGGANRPVIARFGDDAAPPDVIELARELSAATGYVTPTLVVIDEGTAWDKATKKQADASLLRATGRRRNDAVGVILLQQQPSMVNYQSMANASAIDVFRLESDYQTRHLIMQLPERVILAPPSGIVTVGKPGPTMHRDQLLRAIPVLERGAYYGIDKRFH